MRLDPKKIWEDLMVTYWFLPSCMATLAVALSFLVPWLDERHSLDPGGAFGWVVQTQTDGARAVLQVIAGSIIGVAGTTFSITIVAVSFASSNFGPRLIANFMRDRGNQITLGTFIATFVYCLLVLRRVHEGADDGASASYDAFVPHFSVMTALGLALASVGVLIYFIHHVPETINIDGLVAGIGRRLRRGVTDLFPREEDRTGSDDEAIEADDDPDDERAWERLAASRGSVPVTAREAGYLQRVHIERLVRLLDRHDALARVRYRPGDFVVAGDVLLELRPAPASGGGAGGRGASRGEDEGRDGGRSDGDADGEDDPEALPLDAMRDCFETGYRRDRHQDCLFLADQLVEVIARAMSPGINDPFTAITCVSWLKGALIEYVDRDETRPRSAPVGPVLVRPLEFERIIGVAFDQTRQYVCGDRDVALHAMTALAEIGVRARHPEHREAVRRRMDALRAASVATLPAEVGGDDVARRHAEAVRLLDDPAARERRLEDTGWFGGSG